MKIVILCENADAVNYVYPDDIMQELSAYGFNGQIYSKNDIINNPEIFNNTEYVFSTWGMPLFDKNEINAYFPRLKGVFYAAGSVQSFARPFIECGIKVFSAWAANAVPVAEYTVAQIVLANKGFYNASKIHKSDDYKTATKVFANYQGNYRATVGIIGAGMIGKLVIEKLKSYDLEIKVFDPFLSDELAEELGVEKVSLEEIFSSCEVVSNHLADNENTKNMLDYKLFSLMPLYATFINTGRGAQVVEDDLIRFLEVRTDVTALLDVTVIEPPCDGSRFYSLDNCILTPHIAGSSGNEVHRMAKYIMEEFQNLQKNLPCKYEVTAKMLETMA